jgi:outer membrane receptor for monomeric catechols
MPVAYRVTGQSSTLDDTQLVSDPERTKTFELGSKNTFLGGDLTVNTALFHTKKTQQYYRSSGFINATKMYGLDADVAGRLTEKWDVIAGVVLANGKMTARDEATQQLDGKMPEASAKVTANLWSNYRFTDRWNAGVGLRYVGKRTTQNPVESGNIEQGLPAYTVADAMLGYETPRYRAQVNVNNVFDKKHFASGHRRQAIPGERRTLVATVGVKF